MEWTALKSADQISQLREESKFRPILIFKYSSRCSVSRVALSRLERSWDPEKAGRLKSYFLDLINYRSISNMISSQFNVPHESPQVLLIENKNAIYDQSHLGIAFHHMMEAINREKKEDPGG